MDDEGLDLRKTCVQAISSNNLASLKEMVASNHHRHKIIEFSVEIPGRWAFSYKTNLLEFAVTCNNVEACKILVEAQLGFSVYDALVIAASIPRSAPLACVIYFLSIGTPLRSEISKRWPPLRQAVYSNFKPCIRLLMEAGATLSDAEDLTIASWIKEYQQGLAARQLARRATERALQKARVIHKDVIPLIGQWVARSDVENWFK